MLRNTLSLCLALVFGFWLLGGFASPGNSAPAVLQGGSGGGFGLHSLRGRHGFTYSGSAQDMAAVASCGRIDFDGSGNLSAVFTTSVGGRTFRGSFTGTYTVNPNGTGSLTIDLPWLGLQAGGDFVIIDDGSGTYFMSTDPGYSVTGSTTLLP